LGYDAIFLCVYIGQFFLVVGQPMQISFGIALLANKSPGTASLIPAYNLFKPGRMTMPALQKLAPDSVFSVTSVASY
jgi:hypothetical protein